MKKPVPDWLNNSLWSSHHPLPSSPRNDSGITVPISPSDAVRASEPPIAASAYAHSTEGESKDPLTSNASGNCSNEKTGGSSANSTVSVAAPPAAEDISRQTQIQQEDWPRKGLSTSILKRSY